MKCKKSKKVFAFLNYIGIAMLVCALLTLMNGKTVVGAFILLLSIVFMIPDYWLFLIQVKKKNEPLTLYWMSKFFGLILCFLLTMVYIIMEISR